MIIFLHLHVTILQQNFMRDLLIVRIPKCKKEKKCCMKTMMVVKYARYMAGQVLVILRAVATPNLS